MFEPDIFNGTIGCNHRNNQRNPADIFYDKYRIIFHECFKTRCQHM